MMKKLFLQFCFVFATFFIFYVGSLSADPLYQRAKEAINVHNDTLASYFLERLLRERPLSPERGKAKVSLGWTYLNRNYPDSAILILRAYSTSTKSDAQLSELAQFLLAKARIKKKRYRKALRNIKELGERKKWNGYGAGIYLLRAEAEIKLRKYDEARLSLLAAERWGTTKKSKLFTLYWRGVLFEKTGNWPKAEKNLISFLNQYGLKHFRSPEIFYRLGRIYQSAQKTKLAQKTFRQFLHFFPYSEFRWAAIVNLARISSGNNEADTAGKYFEMVRKENPTGIYGEEAYDFLANQKALQGDTHGARKLIFEAYIRGPAYLTLSIGQYGIPEKQEFDAFLKEHPLETLSSQRIFQFSEFLFSNNKPDLLEPFLKDYLSRRLGEMNTPEFFVMYGKILLDRGDNNKAVGYLESAQRLKVSYNWRERAIVYLIEAYQKTDRTREVKAWKKKYQSLFGRSYKN